MAELDRDGWRIAYRVEGNPQGPPLLLVPGASHRMAHWGRLPGLLAPHARLILFDPRGFGASDRRVEPYTLDDVLGDLAALLDVASVDRAFILGQALGGMYAQAFALRFPERVRGLIAVATSHRGPSALGISPATAEALKAITPGLSREEVFAIQNDVLSHPGWRAGKPDDFVALLRADLEDPPRRAAMQAAGKALEGFEAESRLPELRMPVLVVHGALDGMVPPENGRQIAALVPNGELVLMEGIGHMPVHEAPEHLAAAILLWVGAQAA